MTHKPVIVPGNRERRFDNWVQCTCKGIEECSNHDMCSMIIGYMCGRKPPNYPVPARYHVSLDPNGLDTMDILANILFHADAIFYLHDYDYVD